MRRLAGHRARGGERPRREHGATRRLRGVVVAHSGVARTGAADGEPTALTGRPLAAVREFVDGERALARGSLRPKLRHTTRGRSKRTRRSGSRTAGSRGQGNGRSSRCLRKSRGHTVNIARNYRRARARSRERIVAAGPSRANRQSARSVAALSGFLAGVALIRGRDVPQCACSGRSRRGRCCTVGTPARDPPFIRTDIRTPCRCTRHTW